LHDNTADCLDGGGAHVTGGTFHNNLVIGNDASAGFGGGVYARDAFGHDCLVVGNQAHKGGGVFAAGTSELWNFTVQGNTRRGGDGGGVALEDTALLGNSIVWNNTDLADRIDNVNTAGGAEVRYSCSFPTAEGEGNIGEDPQFVGEGNYRLRAGSPCVDAGERRDWMPEAVDWFDGQRRVEPGDGSDGRDVWVDIGADEAAVDAVGGPSGADESWTWRVVPDARLQLQRTAELTGAAAWEDAGEAFMATNGVWTLEEPFEGTGTRFYRLIWRKE
jgi:hypothetical protein